MTLGLIKTSLASQVVSVATITPKVLYGKTLPNKAETAHTPCRLILSGDEKGKGGEGNFIAIGKLTQSTFTITDLLLWKAVGSSPGLWFEDGPLTEYTDNWLAMIRNWRNAGQTQAAVVGFRVETGTYEWPTQSTNLYHGALCIVRMIEYYSGA